MIKNIEALNYRCLRYVNKSLGPFVALVGPNASGKTTFIDVLKFMGDVLSSGLNEAIASRTDYPLDLVWGRKGAGFELAIDAAIPKSVFEKLPTTEYCDVRYELRVSIAEETNEASISAERVSLKTDKESAPEKQRDLFPEMPGLIAPQGIYQPQLSRKKYASKTVVHKNPDKNDNFYSEVYDSPKAGTGGKGWLPSFKFGPQKSALANIPDDGTRFPVSTWLRDFLMSGIRSLVLNSLIIRKASRPGQGDRFVEDGSNLPWVVERVRSKHPERFAEWMAHVQTAFPDIESVSTVERPDDKHRYLVVRYHGGIDVPSWMVSDGTLRFLALTIIAYLPESGDVYLIEEPENGIHPRAIEALFQSLSSAYEAQVIVASHSPVMLGLVRQDQVLCFAKSMNETDIVSGTAHPALKAWQGECSLGVLFASGILG